MPLPRWLAVFNRQATNRITGPLAPWLPGFGVVLHVGRKSHRPYRTPVNVFPRTGGFVIALTYGPSAEWVRNVQASGGCRLETRGRNWRLTRPLLFHDPHRRSVPVPVRLILGFARVADFLDLSIDDAASVQR